MRKEVGIILLVVLFAGIVYAAEMPQNYEDAVKMAEPYGIDEAQLNSLIEQYIEEFGCSSLELYKDQILGIKIPDKIPYKKEIVNLYVANESFGTIIIFDGNITNFSCEESLEHTYEVYIKDSLIIMELIRDFEIDVFLEKLDSGEITVKGIGFGKKIKWFFSKIAMKWFF